MMATRRTREERGETAGSVTDAPSRLIRQEVEAIRDELLDKLRPAAVDLALLGMAGGTGYAALLSLSGAAADLMHGGTPPRQRGLPLWAAAGLTGTLELGIAAAAAGFAVSRVRRADLVPRQSLASVGETAQSVGETAQSVGETAQRVGRRAVGKE
jgi:hypothetical protein